MLQKDNLFHFASSTFISFCNKKGKLQKTVENRFQLDCFSSSCKLCKNPIINRCLKTSEKWKLLLNSTVVIPSLFKTTKSCNIVDIWCLFFPPETDKWMCQTNQKHASEVRPWYFGLNVSSHSGSRQRSVLVSFHMKTFDRTVSSRCWQYAVKSHRFHSFKLAVRMTHVSTWWVHVIYAFKQTVVYWDLLPTWCDDLNELLKDGWQTFQTSQSSEECVW